MTDLSQFLSARAEHKKVAALRRQLAAAGASVTEGALRHWLSGERTPRLFHLEHLLDALELGPIDRDVARRLHREAVLARG